jgi:uncharacterized Zn finger protein
MSRMALTKAQTVANKSGRTSEWSQYLATLREQNRRRPRMMEVLDSLDNRPRPIIKNTR